MKVRRISALFLAILMLVSLFSFSASAYSTVKKGSKGEDVKTLQMMLNAVDNAGLDTDGIFGSGTQTAVKKFQKANGLDADGIVGAKTWAALESKYNAASDLKIAAGNYDPVSIKQGGSYSINGKILPLPRSSPLPWVCTRRTAPPRRWLRR